MLIRVAVLAAMLCAAACGNEPARAEEPAGTSAKPTEPSTPAARAEEPAAPTAKPTEPSAPAATGSTTRCGDGKITVDFTSPRAGVTVVLYCRDGAPYLQRVAHTPDGDQEKRSTRTSMTLWHDAWRLADEAGWKKAADSCTRADEPLTTEITIARDGVKRTFSCQGELAPAFERLASALRDEADRAETAPARASVPGSEAAGPDPALVGVWHECPEMGAGWCGVRLLRPDGTYAYHRGQIDCGTNARAGVFGMWSRSAKGLELFEQSVDKVQGGTAGNFGCEGGKSSTEVLQPPAQRTVSIGACTSKDPQSAYPCLRFDGKPYWRFSEDPAFYAP